jgi:hypothetical protein
MIFPSGIVILPPLFEPLTNGMHLTIFINAAPFRHLSGYHPCKIALGKSQSPYAQGIELCRATSLLRKLMEEMMAQTPEHDRLSKNGLDWKRWGPYLSERQWGTVREDYSHDDNA